MSVIEKIFGTHSSRELKRIEPLVDKIEALRPAMQALSDGIRRGKSFSVRQKVVFFKDKKIVFGVLLLLYD